MARSIKFKNDNYLDSSGVYCGDNSLDNKIKTINDNISNLNKNLNIISEEVTKLKMLGIKVLWTNPSPTSSFGAQNITLTSEDYDYLIVLYKIDSDQNLILSAMSLKGLGFYLTGFSVPSRTTASGLLMKRDISYIDNTTLSVSAAETKRSSLLNGYETSTIHLTPLQILGVKIN